MIDRAYQDGTAGTGRALIAVTPPPSRAARVSVYPHLPLVAQLLATRLDLPQSRARRREVPLRAAAAYIARGTTPLAGGAVLLRRDA